VSTLIPAEDFACLDGLAPQILGADLFEVGGAEYVVVSSVVSSVGPVSNTDAGGYRGCITIPIANAASGAIARTSSGLPSVARWVRSSDGRFTGPCTYAEGATSFGLVVPMQFMGESLPWFRILRTSISAP
jgi:hypothetical protein